MIFLKISKEQLKSIARSYISVKLNELKPYCRSGTSSELNVSGLKAQLFPTLILPTPA
jgi:hypothetical protein